MKSTLLLLKSKYNPESSLQLECPKDADRYLFRLSYSSITCVIPPDAHYLYVCNTINNDVVLPTELVIGGHNILEPTIKEHTLKTSLRLQSKHEGKYGFKAVLSPNISKTIVGEVDYFDLPVMIVCSDHKQTIILGAEAHCKNGLKWVTAISKDGGDTFEIHVNYLHDKEGRIIKDKEGKAQIVPITELVYDRINDRVLSLTASYCYASDDHGESWYLLSYFGNNIKRPSSFNNTMYCPTTGIQLTNGVIVAPMRFYRKEENTITKAVNFVVYSKDYGKTWIQSPSTEDDVISDEALVVEYKKNRVMINSRGGTEYWMDKTNNGRRVFVATVGSKNCKMGWFIKGWKLEPESDGKLYDPICNASILKLPKTIKKGVIFANPYMPDEYWPRKNILLRYSKNCVQWKNVSLLTPFGERIRGYCALAASEHDVYFAYPDSKGVIMFGKITDTLNGI